jgi:hypothetical protein
MMLMRSRDNDDMRARSLPHNGHFMRELCVKQRTLRYFWPRASPKTGNNCPASAC